VIIKKKFKPAPTTPAEIKDCSEQLEAEQLLSVLCGTTLRILLWSFL